MNVIPARQFALTVTNQRTIDLLRTCMYDQRPVPPRVLRRHGHGIGCKERAYLFEYTLEWDGKFTVRVVGRIVRRP